MKKNHSLLLFIFALSFMIVACNSDDDNNAEQEFESTNLTPTITTDFDAIINLIPIGPIDVDNPLNIDITDLISFGQPSNISTRNFVSVVDEFETITLGQPIGLAPGDIMWYSRVDYFDVDTGADINSLIDSNFIEFSVPTSANFVQDPYAPLGFQVVDAIELIIAGAEDDLDVNTKYDIRVLIERGGTIYGYFTIDPKIRIKSRN